jgi:hypothetical protein
MSWLPREKNRQYYEAALSRSLPDRDKVPISCPGPAHTHGDRTPSATAFLNSGAYHCNKCGSKGGIVAYEMVRSGCDKATAIRNIEKITGVPFDANGRWQYVKDYVYRDREGHPAAKKILWRMPDGEKVCSWEHWDSASSGWAKGAGDIPRSLYNAPLLVGASIVFFAEGESCCDALMEDVIPRLWPEKQAKGLRIVATTGPDGAWEPHGKDGRPTKPKWRDGYDKSFSDKGLVIFEDNDPSGRALADHVAAHARPYAAQIKRVAFSDKVAKYDIGDWVLENKDDPERMIREFQKMIEDAPLWRPEAKETHAAGTVWDTAEDVLDGIDREDKPFDWIQPDTPIARGYLTQIYAPRGLGKSVYMLDMAVKLARAKFKVLVLDRDNPSSTVWSRLRNLGSRTVERGYLKVITRERCPSLFPDPSAWLSFPFDGYDVVFIDSWNAFTIGLSEKDTAGSGQALTPLLKVCYAGAAVLILGNVTRDGAHSRLNGVVEDRADFVFEVRDATDLEPKGKLWVEQLVAQGAKDWQARTTRRQGKTKLRLALCPSKVREGPELEARVKEIDFEADPWWTVNDVTNKIDAAGEQARKEKVQQKIDRHAQGVELLRQEILERAAAGKPAIRKTEAEEEFLKGKGFKQTEARDVTGASVFVKVQRTGRGQPCELHLDENPPYTNHSTTKMAPSADPSVYAASEAPDFGGVHKQRATEIDPSETRVNGGDFESPIIVVKTPVKGAPNGSSASGRRQNSVAPNAKSGSNSDDGGGVVI